MAEYYIEFLFDPQELSSRFCVILLWGKFTTHFHPVIICLVIYYVRTILKLTRKIIVPSQTI